ncbi:unnamed protein product [Symbiodinium sp. CCMP2592]|nr:unnamed protein product [Symbiodinium sp. CCMP2592]
MALPKKAAELKQYLRNANLPEEFARHCLRTLQMGSLEDFVSYVSSSNYEAELKTRVVDTCAATKGKPLILARVRSAWRSARASLQGPKSSCIAWMESAELSELSKDSEVVDCDIGSLIAQLQNYVFRRRVRIKDAFRDFDLARTSRITKPNFARALCTAAPILKPFEVEALTEHFTESGLQVCWPRVVNYTLFCQAIDDIFGPSNLEKAPKQKVPYPGEKLFSAGGYFKPKSASGDEELRVILYRVATLCKTRGVEFASCLRAHVDAEHPRGSGKVTAAVLLRRFPFMAEFSENDMSVLLRRYSDENGTVHLHSLETDVQDIMEVNRAEEQAAGVYSDDDDMDDALSRSQESPSPSFDAPKGAQSPRKGRRPTRYAVSARPWSRQRPPELQEEQPRTIRPQTAPSRRSKRADISCQEVLTKIGALSKKRCFRLKEVFRDFDRLRRGVVPCCQMRSALAIAGLDLLAAELQVLEETYSATGPGDSKDDPKTYFRYRDFCADVSLKEAPKPKSDSSRAKSSAPLTKLISTIKAKARTRRLELLSAFADRSSGSVAGRVRRSALLRVMHMLGFPLTDLEVDLLCGAFSDDMGFNYLRFCSVVDPFMAPADESKKTVQPPPSIYFDFAGRVVPHPSLSRPASAPQLRR